MIVQQCYTEAKIHMKVHPELCREHHEGCVELGYVFWGFFF